MASIALDDHWSDTEIGLLLLFVLGVTLMVFAIVD